jgi:hypothetical protein
MMKKIYVFHVIFLLIKPGAILASEELIAEKSEGEKQQTSATESTTPRKVSGVAQDLSRQFSAANEALVANKNAEAIAHFEKIPDHSFAQYFNLGCAHLKNNDTTEAWIVFEKSRAT